jgi:K+-sensing histidine kinase KdpD
MLDDADIAAAKWTWESKRAAGRGSETLPGAKRLFLPMHTGRGPIGVSASTATSRDRCSLLTKAACSTR